MNFTNSQTDDEHLAVQTSPPPPMFDSSVKGDRILLQAAQLFTERGYGETTMADIAAASDLAKPTLYHHFRSKEEMLLAIHDRLFEWLMQNAASRRERGLTPLEAVEDLIRSSVRFMTKYGSWVGLFFESPSTPSAEVRAGVLQQQREYQTIVRETLSRAIRSGDLREADERLVVVGFFGILNWIGIWYDSSRSMEPTEVEEFVVRLLMDGLRRRPLSLDVDDGRQSE